MREAAHKRISGFAQILDLCWNDYPTVTIAAYAFLPVLLISAMGWWYGNTLRQIIPISITNLAGLKLLLGNLLRPSVSSHDSWGPMLRAFDVEHSPERNNLYEILFFKDHVRFQYPPSSLLYIRMLSAIGLKNFRALNAINSCAYVANATLVGALGWSLFRKPLICHSPNKIGIAGIAVAAAFIFYPLIRADILGQIQIWIDLLFTSALLMWLLERRMVSGALIGLACTIKPQLTLLILWGVVWGEPSFVAGILAVFVPVTIAAMLRYGLQNYFGYIDVLRDLSRYGESFFANNSINGILNGYFAGGTDLSWHRQDFSQFHLVVYLGTLLASVLAIAFITASPILGKKNKRPDIGDLSQSAICTVIGSPVAWEHHYGILLPIFVVALRFIMGEAAGRRRTARLLLLAISWTLSANFIPFAHLLAGTAFSVLQAHLFFGALLLLIVLFSHTGSPGPVFELSRAPPATMNNPGMTERLAKLGASVEQRFIATKFRTFSKSGILARGAGRGPARRQNQIIAEPVAI